MLVAAFNAAENQSRFHFFYRNCSNQTKGVFYFIFLHTIGDRCGG